MREKSRQRHMVDRIFPLILFLLFTFCVLCVLGLGVRFYQSTLERGQQNESVRMATAYVREVIRQKNKMDAVRIGELEGAPCLLLDDQEGYVTYIYLEDNMLMELFASKEAEVSRRDGQEIVPLESFELEYTDTELLKITCGTLEGEQETLLIGRLLNGEGETERGK